MRSIESFINEKLTLNNQSQLQTVEYRDEDFPIRIKTKDGKKFLWFKWWEYLMKNGPTSKRNLLTSMNLEPTSYSTEFARLSKVNIIIPLKGKDRGKLMAVKPQDWHYQHANY